MIDFYHTLLDTVVIESNYLQDVKADINEVYEKLESQDEIIHDTIEKASDISSATSQKFSEVKEWKGNAIEKLEELGDDIAEFTGTSNETDVKELMHQIKTVMNNAKTSEGKARFADFKGASDNSELAKLMEYNEEKHDEEMRKAKNAKESAIKDANNDSSKDIINVAYKDFKVGKIGYSEYTAILESVQKTGKSKENSKLDNESMDTFVKYLDDNNMLEQYMNENLGSETNYYYNQAREDYENRSIDKVTYKSISSGILANGTIFIKNAVEGKLSGKVSKKVERDVNQWAEKHDPESILKGQHEIEWENVEEKGGYESSIIWEMNIGINDYKTTQNNYLTSKDSANKQKAIEAEKNEMQLRKDYNVLSDYLIDEDDDPHEYGELTLNDGSKFDYRIDNEGYIHYKTEQGYSYYEETHKRTISDDLQANALRSYIAGRATGGAANTFKLSQKTWETVGRTGSLGQDYMTNYMNSNKLKNSKLVIPNLLYKPDVDQVKTTIYREDKETGEIDNMVIDSLGNEMLDYRSWKPYNY